MLRVDGKWSLDAATLISCCHVSPAFRHVSGVRVRVGLTCKCKQSIIDKWARLQRNIGCETVLPR